MIRVVADTNVYISALNFGGVADDVLALARRGVITLCTSPSILEEIEGVLVSKFTWSTARASEATGLIKAFAEVVDPTEKVRRIREDEPDNRILECAREAKADVIVSGDSHLRRLGSFEGIPIAAPGEFLVLRLWSRE